MESIQEASRPLIDRRTKARDYDLVLANGAFKSGSTWLREIVLQLRDFEPVPKRYARRSLPHWVCETRVTRLLDDPAVNGPILSKSHIFHPATANEILKRPNARVLNIRRDTRDAIVSSYYYFMQRRKVNLSFAAYYRLFGRVKAAELVAYHKVWGVDDPKVLTLRFEDLKRDFYGSVESLADFLGTDLGNGDLERIQRETSLQNLRKKRGEEGVKENSRFFRRGAIGDWKEHFSESQLRDLEKIETEGLRGGGKLAYWMINSLRRAMLRGARRMGVS